MNKFTVVHAVDYRSGIAKVGKCHVITKAEELDIETKQKRVAEMQEKNKIVFD